MTRSIEQRLDVLEKKDKPPFRVISCLPGETVEQARSEKASSRMKSHT